jgi:hypothetical protein
MRMAYFMLRDREDYLLEELSEYEEHIIDQGNLIGEKARGLFTDRAVMISETNGDAAARQTFDQMKDQRVKVIFEAAFIDDGMIARADIIERDPAGGGWKLIEVKSAVCDTSTPKKIEEKKKRYSPDAAYTLMLMSACGVEVSGVSLMAVSNNYRKGRPDSELFVTIEITAEARKQLSEMKKHSGALACELKSGGAPAWSLKTACKKCKYYQECPVKDIEQPVILFSGIRQPAVDKLVNEGWQSITDIPDGYFNSDKDRIRYMMHKAIKDGAPFTGPNFKRDLDMIKWPVYYLDFETLAAPLPFYDELAPHEMALVQYSLHIRRAPGDPLAAVEHFDYIVKPDFDCRRELIEKLIVELYRAGDNGSIVVYSPFENSRIGEAIKRFPDLAPQLKAIQKRIFDLLVFLKDNYYHPDFHGSYSIKKTLPALVPGLKYDGLAVKNGGEAIVHLHKIVTGQLTPDEYQQTRADLLAYCRLDTMAMAALHEKLMHAV